MVSDDDLPIRQRLQHWIAHLQHILPAQAPIRDFVHHNTLHGFQHLLFDEALAAAHRLTGASVYWPESRFHAAYAAGRVTDDDLRAALVDAGFADPDDAAGSGQRRSEVLLASLLAPSLPACASRQAWLHRERGGAEAAPDMPDKAGAADWRPAALARWMALCDRVGKDWTLRSLLDYLSGEDVLEKVRATLQHHLAAHLDLGIAAWRNPARERGFFAAWRASAAQDLFWEITDLHNIRDEIIHLPDNALDVLLDELARLIPDDRLWSGYLERLALELPGWSGMFQRQAAVAGSGIEMVDYLAVRVLLERLLCEDLMRRLTGLPMGFDELKGYFAAELAEFYVRDSWRQGGLDEAMLHRVAYLLDADEREPVDEAVWEELAATIAAGDARPVAASGLSELERGRIWLLAYERHYREALFSALAANAAAASPAQPPTAQVVMCMDDREEGTRRHLEEIAPAIQTYGAAGFFGVPMYWQGLDDAEKTALCPVVVQPKHLVRELPRAGAEAALAHHQRRRESRLRWRDRLYQSTRRHPVSGTLLSALAAGPALLALLAASLLPGWWGETAHRWRQKFEGRLPCRLALTADQPTAATPATPQAGFTDLEQIERVATFLRTIGLTSHFAPLVLIFGHGSGSRNNPHLSAYDCGACSGRHGGPNARVFASMANRPAVRAGLAEGGLAIPDTCWFVAAEHNTCDDGIEWYDLESVPAVFQEALDTLVHQLGEACRAHAAERCRRLASAPVRPTPAQARRHMIGRANDISQARPELGHATNAAALIGRRTMSRGLFLDRRVFLISYDPAADEEGAIVESILLAAGPVGAGIALEYYFSSVDNERFGCGSKVTHNITGLFGVMDGADSDLRTGLPLQMVEIHEPMRLLVVVEQTPEILTAILHRQPPLQELINNAWITLAAKSPEGAAITLYCPRRGWLPWSGGAALPQVARSLDWFAGESAALPPALILGGAG